MMGEKRFTIKPQDDYWAVVDNHNDDKVCIINGIHTEIEAEWLCDFMNEQQDQINSLIVDKHILVDNIDKARLYIKAKDRHIKHQQATIKKQDIEIQSLNLHIEKLVDGDEISQLLMREYERSDELEKEIERIKQMYLKKLDKRERQIDIMKFHILNFCTDDQIQSIRNDLEIESKLRRCKK